MAAGLIHSFLDEMNKKNKDAENAFFSAAWNGLVYNAVVVWVSSDTDESPDCAADRLEETVKSFSVAMDK